MASWKVKHKSSGTPGTLNIMEGMLTFEPNDEISNLKLQVQSRNIESKKYSKEGSHHLPLFNIQTNNNIQGKPHIFEFETYQDMHACRDVINKAFAYCESLKSNSVLQTWSYASRFSEKIMSCRYCIRS